MKSKRQERHQPLKSALWLFSFLKPYTGWITLGVLSAAAAAFIEIWTGSLIEQLTTHADQGDRQYVLQTAYAVLAAIAVGVPAKYFMVYGLERSGSLAMRDVRNFMMDHIGRLPVHVLEKHHSGDLVSRVTNDIRLLQRFIIRDVGQWFYHPVVFIGCFVYLLTIQWKLVLFSLLLLPVSLLVSFSVGKKLQHLTEQAQQTTGQSTSLLKDTLGGMPIVRSYLLQGQLFHSYRSLLELTRLHKLAMHKRESWLNPILLTLMMAPIIFSVLYGSYLISQGVLKAGELVAFLYLLNMCMEPLNHIPTLLTNTMEMGGALKRVWEIVSEPGEHENHPAGNRQRGLLLNHAGEPPIVFDKVSYSYENGPPILRELSFTVEEGRTIALVGASGSGKSTIFKLLCGFYPLQEKQGIIRIHGQSMESCHPEEVRSLFSVVSQDSYLFTGTIAENIAYGRAEASMDEIMHAARMAEAHTFIMELPEGYQSEVGERGGLLSGGQRQRIAIARAFLKNAPILLLDEPTSALDTASETLVQEALNTLMTRKTTLIIAHRLTTIQDADEIWVMEQGEITERGTHAQLLARKGTYARLVNQEFEQQASLPREVVYS